MARKTRKFFCPVIEQLEIRNVLAAEVEIAIGGGPDNVLRVELGGVPVDIARAPGISQIVCGASDGRCIPTVAYFPTFSDPAEFDRLVVTSELLPAGSLVIDLAFDTSGWGMWGPGNERFEPSAINARSYFESLGSSAASSLSYRQPWVFSYFVGGQVVGEATAGAEGVATLELREVPAFTPSSSRNIQSPVAPENYFVQLISAGGPTGGSSVASVDPISGRNVALFAGGGGHSIYEHQSVARGVTVLALSDYGGLRVVDSLYVDSWADPTRLSDAATFLERIDSLPGVVTIVLVGDEAGARSWWDPNLNRPGADSGITEFAQLGVNLPAHYRAPYFAVKTAGKVFERAGEPESIISSLVAVPVFAVRTPGAPSRAEVIDSVDARLSEITLSVKMTIAPSPFQLPYVGNVVSTIVARALDRPVLQPGKFLESVATGLAAGDFLNSVGLALIQNDPYARVAEDFILDGNSEFPFALALGWQFLHELQQADSLVVDHPQSLRLTAADIVRDLILPAQLAGFTTAANSSVQSPVAAAGKSDDLTVQPRASVVVNSAFSDYRASGITGSDASIDSGAPLLVVSTAGDDDVARSAADASSPEISASNGETASVAEGVLAACNASVGTDEAQFRTDSATDTRHLDGPIATTASSDDEAADSQLTAEHKVGSMAQTATTITSAFSTDEHAAGPSEAASGSAEQLAQNRAQPVATSLVSSLSKTSNRLDAAAQIHIDYDTGEVTVIRNEEGTQPPPQSPTTSPDTEQALRAWDGLPQQILAVADTDFFKTAIGKENFAKWFGDHVHLAAAGEFVGTAANLLGESITTGRPIDGVAWEDLGRKGLNALGLDQLGAFTKSFSAALGTVAGGGPAPTVTEFTNIVLQALDVTNAPALKPFFAGLNLEQIGEFSRDGAIALGTWIGGGPAPTFEQFVTLGDDLLRGFGQERFVGLAHALENAVLSELKGPAQQLFEVIVNQTDFVTDANAVLTNVVHAGTLSPQNFFTPSNIVSIVASLFPAHNDFQSAIKDVLPFLLHPNPLTFVISGFNLFQTFFGPHEKFNYGGAVRDREVELYIKSVIENWFVDPYRSIRASEVQGVYDGDDDEHRGGNNDVLVTHASTDWEEQLNQYLVFMPPTAHRPSGFAESSEDIAQQLIYSMFFSAADNVSRRITGSSAEKIFFDLTGSPANFQVNADQEYQVIAELLNAREIVRLLATDS